MIAKAVDTVLSPALDRIRKFTKLEGLGLIVSCSESGYLFNLMATFRGKQHMTFFGKDAHGDLHVGKG